MTKRDQHAEMTSGDTVTIRIAVIDVATQAPQSLTGGSFIYAIKTAVNGTELVRKDDEITLTTTETTNDTIVIPLLPADTASLAGTYYHECQATDSGGQVSTPATGRLRIYPDGIE